MTVSELIAELSQVNNLNLPIVISDNCGNGMCFAEQVDTSILVDDGEGGFIPCVTLMGKD
ncbi:MAG: hypothetical protein JHC33_03760 [Ignisphaera sp.]|nr:hypothetical protein [Ignisphaera sp.]